MSLLPATICAVEKELPMSSQNELVTVKFDGQAHQVDIDTFTQALLNYSTVIQAAASEVGATGDIGVSVCAIESGSLDVLVSIVSTGFGGLLDFITENKEVIASVITVAGGLYGFKQKLAGKGKVVDVSKGEGDDVSVVTEGGSVTVNKTVYNLYVNHPEATEAIDRTFERLDEMPEIEGFELSSNGEVGFRAERDEFSGIASSCNHEPDNTRHDTESEVVLSVIKPFLGSSKTRKWEFYYDGRKISAPITDPSFQDRIGSYSFSVGTKIIADIDVEKVYIADADVYVDKSYRVVKVHNVVQPERTEPLF